jgi:hypothetical protein
MTTFTGKDEVNTFVLVVLKNAIKLYVNTGMKANRAYTPANMLAKAGEFTGKTYKRGQLQIAHDDLQLLYQDILNKRKESAQ